jgi:hypothetical protein
MSRPKNEGGGCVVGMCGKKRVDKYHCAEHISPSAIEIDRARGLVQRWISLGMQIDCRESNTMARHIALFVRNQRAERSI